MEQPFASLPAANERPERITTVGVLPGIAAGCVYPVLTKCELPLDGQKHLATISAQIYYNNDPAPQSKHFALGYHLDRNVGDIKTGEAGGADIFSRDGSLKKIGASVQSKLDSPVPGSVLRDALRVSFDIEDNDAP